MSVTPHQLDLWSSNMSHLYQSLEGELIRLIIKRLNSDSDDITEWQREKLQELHLFNKETAQMISKVTGLSEKEITRMFETTGQKIIGDIDSSIPYDNLPLPTNLDNVMRAYHNQVWGDINNYVNQTLLSTNFGYATATTRMYNEIINKTTAAFNSGLFSFDQALERTIQEWAQKGIKSTFVDKGGHTWSLERYVRTVLKSTLGNTYNELRTERMDEYGIHTVVVTSHMGSRAECSRIQGNVVDLRSYVPPDSEYKSIYDPYWGANYGSPEGHRGVNCRHAHIPFIPGVNTNNQPKYDAKENAKVALLTQKQRMLERQVVKFKKNQMVSDALGQEANAKEWSRKTRLAQKRIRDLVDSNDYLSRNYPREKVYTPINTLLKDFSYEDLDKNGIIRKTINVEKYNRHVLGTKEYEAYVQRGTKSGGKPSYLTIPADKAQKYVDSLLTNEDLKHQRSTVDFPGIIGYYVDQKTGEELPTTRAIIHISKTGIHIVPTKPKGW